MKYEKPNIEMIVLKTEDVICASGGLGVGTENENDWVTTGQ